MHKLSCQPTSPYQALIFAEAHLRAIGLPELSPISFAYNYGQKLDQVTAGIFPTTKLRAQEIVPGLRLKSGNSIIDIVKSIPTNHEIVYKTNHGGLFRMPTDKFVQLAVQQGYRKVWNVKNFLITLKALLSPVLDSIPLMWVMKWVLNFVRGKKALMTDKVPTLTDRIERGSKKGSDYFGKE